MRFWAIWQRYPPTLWCPFLHGRNPIPSVWRWNCFIIPLSGKFKYHHKYRFLKYRGLPHHPNCRIRLRMAKRSLIMTTPYHRLKQKIRKLDLSSFLIFKHCVACSSQLSSSQTVSYLARFRRFIPSLCDRLLNWITRSISIITFLVFCLLSTTLKTINC